MKNTDQLVAREKQFREKVNLLERLHKTCQLEVIGMLEPILNESRYLSRALSDVLFFPRETEEYKKALHAAEHAIACGINDCIDSLITFIKIALNRVKNECSKFDIYTSEYGLEYIKLMDVLGDIEPRIVDSRSSRERRDEIYIEIADEYVNLNIIAQFALKIPAIEAQARWTQYDVDLPISDGHPHVWLANQLSSAISGDPSGVSLFIHLQPKYELLSNRRKCVGAEALARLTIGTAKINPLRFIGTAERTGLIGALGDFVRLQTLQVLRDHPEVPSISVNVSPFELESSDYSTNLIREAREYLGDGMSRLELEITESAALKDVAAFQHLKKISDAGIRLSIDDFGTGETKFEYIAKSNISVLKIDKTIRDAYKEAPSFYEKLIKAIVATAKACEMEIVLEGVEDEADINLFSSNFEITKFQGYGFGMPVEIDEFFEKHSLFFE